MALLVEKGVNDERWSRGVCCASCVNIMNVGKWTDWCSWFVAQRSPGGCALGTGHRGVIRGNPLLSGSGRLCLTGACPYARAVGRRGHMDPCDIVSHLANPQYVLLLFSATVSVCQGKQCYKAKEGNVEAFLVLFQPTQLSVHISSSPCPEHNIHRHCVITKNVPEKLKIKKINHFLQLFSW